LAHLVDKPALNEGLFEGEGVLTDTFVAPSMRYHSQVERAIARYAYDPRRAELLLSEAGLVKGSDGTYSSATERMAVEIRFPEIAEYAQATPIILDTYRKVGIDASMQGYPSNLIRDGQSRSNFPGLDFTGGGISENSTLQKFVSSNIPRPETRWTGSNWGGWSNADYDRLVDAFDRTLDLTVRDEQMARIMKLLSEEVPAIPLYFVLRPIAHTYAVQGPRPGSPQSTRWDNVHEWAFR
jgi:peptide/nickel transport system substrate-binding protein